ncbi:MAG: bifunctional 3-deoxy-7-phosphoheptulonate synthase/chorismate mutase type II [Bacteroidales bacterium]|nr:bifunctional 3-deoxy-7-phosphoheptulonate synthase/chorismate mutase type II [Candidatus Colicola caccequi]
MSNKIYILGPCAAESEEQIMTIAQELAAVINANANENDNEEEVRGKNGVPGGTIFRAGIWKPRTSPNTFQGIGEQGLKWLQRVQDELGIDTATEVSNAEQVKAAANAHIAYIWIGARTSANPIAVEEIANAINANVNANVNDNANVNVNVNVNEEEGRGESEEVRGKNGVPGGTFKGIGIKNPVNNDVSLWIGNIERLERTGLPIMAIHRGCNHHPCWEMAYQLRTLRPDIPLLLDPSHISGDRRLIPNLYQTGIQLGYDGFMIEVHPNPQQALSDAKQQLTPEELAELINVNVNDNANDNVNVNDNANVNVNVNANANDNVNVNHNVNANYNDLLWLRAMMDEQDDAIWAMIDKRMQISKQIGEWKKVHGVDIVQPTRYQDILQRRLEWAQAHHISDQTIQQIMDAIHEESVRVQS